MSSSPQSVSSADPETLKEEGNKLFRKGEFQEAASIYTSAIDSTESDTSDKEFRARLFHNRALAYFKLGNDAGALKDVQQATELSPTYLKAWILAATLLNKRGDSLEAMDALHNVLEVELEHQEAIKLLQDLLDANILKDISDSKPSKNKEKTTEDKSSPKKKSRSSDESGDSDDQNEESRSRETKRSKDKSEEKKKIETEPKRDSGSPQADHKKFLKELARIKQIKKQKYISSAEMAEKTKAECLRYCVLSQDFYAMRDLRLARSCCFVAFHLCKFITQESKSYIKELKARILSYQQNNYLRGEKKKAHLAHKWIDMAFELLPNSESEISIELKVRAAREKLRARDLKIKALVEEMRECSSICGKKSYKKLSPTVKATLALALNSMGNWQAAIQTAEEAKAEFEGIDDVNGVSFCLKMIGVAQVGKRDFEEAEYFLELSIALTQDPIDAMDIMENFGTVYDCKSVECFVKNERMGQQRFLQKSKEHYNEARKMSYKYNDEWTQIETEFKLVSISPFLEESEKRELNLLDFDTLLTRAVNSKYNRLDKLYVAYANVYYFEGKYTKVIELCLQAESLANKQLENLKKKEIISMVQDLDCELQIINMLLQFSYLLSGKLEESLLITERIKNRDTYFNLSVQQSNNAQMTIDRINQISSSINSCIIVLSVTGVYLLVWVIFPKSLSPIKFFSFNLGNEVKDDDENGPKNRKIEPISLDQKCSLQILLNIRKLQISISPSDSATAKQPLNIFETIFKVIEQDLTTCGCKTLVLVPDNNGILNNERLANVKCCDGTSLLNKYNLSIAPTISMIIDNTKHESASNVIDESISTAAEPIKALIVCDPQSNLPSASDEANLLKNIFNDRSSETPNFLTGPNAEKKEIKTRLVDCTLFHIAAHAKISTVDQEYRAAILLAGHQDGDSNAQNSDSALAYAEIATMSLSKMELVFLNCCKTVNGHSDALFGLARAFFVAGARQVVVYNGPVADSKQNSDFVGWFYEDYFRSRRAEVALASAQRHAREMGYSEEFWAQHYVMKRY